MYVCEGKRECVYLCEGEREYVCEGEWQCACKCVRETGSVYACVCLRERRGVSVCVCVRMYVCTYTQLHVCVRERERLRVLLRVFMG